MTIAARESIDNAQIAMRLLIRSANLDHRLLSDKDWQGAMKYLLVLVGKNGVLEMSVESVK